MTFGLLTLDLPLPANPLTMMLTMVLGAPVLAALAAALSGVTRSSEAAMSTTMPSPMILLATPGVLAPPGALPQSIEAVGEYLPLRVPTTRSVPRRAQDRLARPWRRRRRAELPWRHRRRTPFAGDVDQLAGARAARHEAPLPLGAPAHVIAIAGVPRSTQWTRPRSRPTDRHAIHAGKTEGRTMPQMVTRPGLLAGARLAQSRGRSDTPVTASRAGRTPGTGRSRTS